MHAVEHGPQVVLPVLLWLRVWALLLLLLLVLLTGLEAGPGLALSC
jgi:hypothetical protein